MIFWVWYYCWVLTRTQPTVHVFVATRAVLKKTRAVRGSSSLGRVELPLALDCALNYRTIAHEEMQYTCKVPVVSPGRRDADRCTVFQPEAFGRGMDRGSWKERGVDNGGGDRRRTKHMVLRGFARPLHWRTPVCCTAVLVLPSSH